MGCHQSTRVSNFCVSCRHLSVPTTLQCQDDTNGVLMGHPLCCLSTLISGVKARSAFATPWWLQQHCDTHTWGVTLTCQVSRHVAPVVILAPTRGSLPNFDVYGTICNLYLCEHHAIITTQWSLKVMSHDYNNYNNNYYIHIMYIPYSGNLSREKTFANIAVFEHPRKFYPRNIWGGYRSGFI